MLNDFKKILLYQLFYLNNFNVADMAPIIDRKKSLELAKANNKTGAYEETSEEGLFIFNDKNNRYEYFYNGIIGEIVWDKIPDDIKDMLVKNLDFEAGKELNWLTLQQILLKLNNILGYSYICAMSYDENKQLKLKITKEPKKIYFITSIEINGNELISSKKILHAISEGAEPLSWINKIIYSLSGTCASEFNPGIQSYMIKNKINELYEKYLILGTRGKISYKLNPNNGTAKIIVNIEEGKKYFIDQVEFNDFKFDKKKFINIIKNRGLENNSFDYVSMILMEEYDLPRISVGYTTNNSKINIIASKNLKDESLVVESILFYVKNIKLAYLMEACPVSVGDAFDEWQMREFISKIEFQFEIKLKYTLKPYKDSNRIIIEIEEIIENQNKDIITSSDGGTGIQYPFKWNFPFININITPKFLLNNNMLLDKFTKDGATSSLFSIGANFNIRKKFNKHNILSILDGSFAVNITEILNPSKLIRSLQVSILKYNYLSKSFSFSFTPLNIQKYLNIKQIGSEEIEDKDNIQKYLNEYIYKYTEVHSKKLILFEDNILWIKGYGKYFFHETDDKNTFKLALHLDNTTVFSNKFKMLTTFKGLYNSQDIRSMKSIYKHLSAINNKRDEMLGLLWDYYDNVEEIFTEFKDKDMKDFKTYLISKEVILSNALLDFRLMLLYSIWDFKIPMLGKIDIFFHIFANFNIDVTNKIYRISYGFGLIGNVNNIRCILSAGFRNKLFTEKEKKNEAHEDMKYGFNFEHMSL